MDKLVRFSLKNKSPEVLRAFLMEHTLSDEDITKGFLVRNNWNYQIKFDSLSDGVLILENLPCRVLVSFQTLQGGASFAVVRLIKSKTES